MWKELRTVVERTEGRLNGKETEKLIPWYDKCQAVPWFRRLVTSLSLPEVHAQVSSGGIFGG
jgi:hypothetical protein